MGFEDLKQSLRMKPPQTIPVRLPNKQRDSFSIFSQILRQPHFREG